MAGYVFLKHLIDRVNQKRRKGGGEGIPLGGGGKKREKAVMID